MSEDDHLFRDNSGREWIARDFLERSSHISNLVQEAIWWKALEGLARDMAAHVLEYRPDDTGAAWAIGELKKALDEFIPSRFKPEPTRSERERRRLTASRKKKIMERDKYRCCDCGSHLDLCVDHIIALVNGGTSDDENLQTLCRPCNSKKGSK